MIASLTDIIAYLNESGLEMNIRFTSPLVTTNTIDVEITDAKTTALVSHVSGGSENSPEYYIMLAIRKAAEAGRGTWWEEVPVEQPA